MQDPENPSSPENPSYLTGHLQSSIVTDSSLQSQYETLLANHENLIRSRNQQVREIQESYLTTLKDLENVKLRMQEKKVIQDREITFLRDQHHENIRKTEIEFQKKIDDVQREKMTLESLLADEKTAKAEQIELNEQQKLQAAQLVQEQNDLKEQIATFLKRKSEAELTFIEQQDDLNQSFALEREELHKNFDLERNSLTDLLTAEQFNASVLTGEKNQLEKSIEDLNQNKSELSNLLSQAAQDKTAAQDQFYAQIEAIQQVHKDAVAEINLSFENERQAFKDQVAEIEFTHKNVIAGIEANHMNVVSLNEKYFENERLVFDVKLKTQKDLHTEEQETFTQDRNTLTERISSLETTLNQSQTMNVALKSEITILNDIIIQKENNLKDLEASKEQQLAQKKTEIASLVRFFLLEEHQVMTRVLEADNNFSALSNVRDTLQSNLTDSQDLAKQYQTQIEQAQKALQTAEGKLLKVQNRFAIIEGQLSQSQEKIKAADNRTNEYREDFDRMKIQHSQKEAELQTAKEALIDAERSKEEATVQASGLRRGLIGEKKTNVTLRATISTLTVQVDDEQNKNRQKAQIIQNLESNIRSINELTASQDREIHNLLENQNRLSQEISSLTETIAHLQKDSTDNKEYLANANAQTFRLEQEKVQLQGKIRNLETGLTNTDNLLNAKINEAKKLAADLSDLTDAHSLLTQNMQSAQSLIVESEVKIKHAQDTIADREAQLAALQLQLQELTENQSAIDERHVQDLEHISEMKEFLQGQTKVEQELRNTLQQKEELEENISAQLSDSVLMVARLKAEVTIYEESQWKLKDQLDQQDKSYRSSKDEWSQESNRLRTQIEALRTQISAENAELVILRRELDAKHSGLEGKEKQLRFYSESLNTNKSDLRDQVNKLLRELQLFKSVNPMNDYYKLTQRELARVELQLKKTPMASPDRSRLEECLAELIEQREFLSASIERFQKDFDLKLERLSAMMGGKTFTLTPPPPPSAETGVEC